MQISHLVYDEANIEKMLFSENGLVEIGSYLLYSQIWEPTHYGNNDSIVTIGMKKLLDNLTSRFHFMEAKWL